MGIENTQYIIVRHNNTAHPHCHIVFNRVDNDGKTISDCNDQYRNENVCKQLKDKYNLTYSKGKENVNVQKLKGAEQTKYEIYHAVKTVLPKAGNWKQFEETLKRRGITIEYKYKGQTNEIQGISFRKGEHSFKGSEVDRSFSYSKLDTVLGGNHLEHEQQQHAVTHKVIEKTDNIVTDVADILSAAGGLFDVQPSGYDPNEAENIRQQALNRKKKKKKYKGISR